MRTDISRARPVRGTESQPSHSDHRLPLVPHTEQIGTLGDGIISVFASVVGLSTPGLFRAGRAETSAGFRPHDTPGSNVGPGRRGRRRSPAPTPGARARASRHRPLPGPGPGPSRERAGPSGSSRARRVG